MEAIVVKIKFKQKARRIIDYLVFDILWVEEWYSFAGADTQCKFLAVDLKSTRTLVDQPHIVSKCIKLSRMSEQSSQLLCRYLP